MSLEYMASQLESARTNVEVISKHVRDYVVTQGEWVECVQPTTQSALPQDMSTSVASSGCLDVPITETIASLTAIFEHKGDLKEFLVNHVLRLWSSHS